MSQPRSSIDRLSLPHRLALSLGALIIFALGLLQLLPPACQNGSGPQAFSCEAAMEHLRVIAAAPHPADSSADAQVREYLLAELFSLHLSPREQIAKVPRYGRLHTLHNLTGRLPGTRSGPAVMLCCHYDSVPMGPGAGDDGAAVAALLETMRAIEAGPRLANAIVLLITDGEELGLLGAAGMARDGTLPTDIGIVLNFDARGSSGPSILFETSSGNEPLVRAYASAAPFPVGTSLGYEVYRKMPNDTDFTVFRRAGLRGLNFAFIGGYVNYHTPQDTIANLSRRTLQHIGENALPLARYFGNADLTGLQKTPARDAVFFNPFRGVMVVHASRWIWPLTALVVLLAGLHIADGFLHRQLSIAGLAEAGGRMIAGCGISAGIAWCGWRIAREAINHEWLASTHGFLLRPSPGETTILGLVIAFSVLAIFITLVCAFAWRVVATDADLAAAGVGAWAILAVAAAIWLPGGSYLAAWPALFACIGLLASGNRRLDRGGWINVARILFASAPTLLLLPPSIALFFTALTISNAHLVVPIVSLSTCLLLACGVQATVPSPTEIKGDAHII